MVKIPDIDNVWLPPAYPMQMPGTCPFCGQADIKTAGGFRDHLAMRHFIGIALLIYNQWRDLRLGKKAKKFTQP